MPNKTHLKKLRIYTKFRNIGKSLKIHICSSSICFRMYIPASIAQLGERQTEDLKVPGSIPGGGTIFKM